jgi:hypothetical protein
MSCNGGSHTFGPIPIWSGKSTSTWMFNPMSPVLDSSGVKRIRPSIQLAQSTGVLVRAALRMSNDGNTWDTPVAIGTLTIHANGLAYGDDFVDVSATTKAKGKVQLGLEVQTLSGTAVELAMGSGKFDVEGA